MPPEGVAFLTVTCNWAVISLSFPLSETGNGVLGICADHPDISINGESFSNGLSAVINNLVSRNFVNTLTIRASGTSVLVQDDFKPASIMVVPVPAAGLLLVGALGGLAALRRRKTA
jgi:hypothetical protein